MVCRFSRLVLERLPSSWVFCNKVMSELIEIGMALEILRWALCELPRRPAVFQVQMEIEAIKRVSNVSLVLWLGLSLVDWS